MAVSLESYKFPFVLEELPDKDRAALAMIVTTGSAEQRQAIAGPRAATYASYAEALYSFVVGLHIDEPAEPFETTLQRAQYLAEAARRAVAGAFTDLNPEVARRAGNLYAFLAR